MRGPSTWSWAAALSASAQSVIADRILSLNPTKRLPPATTVYNHLSAKGHQNRAEARLVERRGPGRGSIAELTWGGWRLLCQAVGGKQHNQQPMQANGTVFGHCSTSDDTRPDAERLDRRLLRRMFSRVYQRVTDAICARIDHCSTSTARWLTLRAVQDTCVKMKHLPARALHIRVDTCP